MLFLFFRRSILLGFALFLACCSKQPEQSQLNEVFQFTKNSQYYYNETSNKGVDITLALELDRARDLTNIDFRVALLQEIPSNFSVEEYASKMMTLNEIGAQNQGRGVLILFVESQGVLKIEVAYELEGLFPDGFVGSLQQQAKNYFAGDFFGDFLTTIVYSMSQRQKGDSYEQELAVQTEPDTTPDAWMGGRFLSGGAGVTEDNFFKDKLKKNDGVVYLSETQRLHYDKDQDLKVVVDRFIGSLTRGINDPFLPLLTEGSQYMRLEYPKSASFLKSFHKNFNSDYRVYQEGNLAAVRFADKGALPIFLRKDHEGFWLVDVTKSWALNQQDYKMETIYPANMDHPWMFAFPEHTILPLVPTTPAPVPFPQNIKESIASLEAQIIASPNNASLYFQLADLFYYECYWIRDAIKMAEKGLKLDPVAGGYTSQLIKMKYRYPDLSRLDQIFADTHMADPGNSALSGYYKSYLRSKKNASHLIKKIEDTEAKQYLPIAPFVLKASAAHVRRKRIKLPTNMRQIDVDVVLHSTNWHPRQRPYTTFSLKDENDENTASVSISQLGKNATPTLFINLEGDIQEYTRRPISLETIQHASLSWDDSNKISVSINGEKVVSEFQLSFKPARARAFSRSCQALYKLEAH
ncbi:TPM domain-containing protein [Rubritalea sp.]|uniref:TPM domain-containing protein n=1 Tax=Rubritalea sp. TaxID=2109375 RepID=UPI003EF8CF77